MWGVEVVSGGKDERCVRLGRGGCVVCSIGANHVMCFRSRSSECPKGASGVTVLFR